MPRHSMGRRPVVGYEEQDVYTGWRRVYCYTRKPGVVASIKRKTHKRERREARAEIRNKLPRKDHFRMSNSHTETARALAEEALKLALALNTAEEIQWERSPVPTPRDDTTQRASGGHGDPTGDIVLDPRRVAVRGATVAADQAMKNSIRALREARRDVELTVARWNGE